MNKYLYISKSICIRKGKILENAKVLFSSKERETSAEFLKSVYKDLKLNYPKFFKMDLLSKLGFIASELLFRNESIPASTALIFANSNSSLQTDENYFESMSSFPSPGLFVYTLPNIMLGEISIRHQLISENCFLIMETFDAELFENQILANIAAENGAKAVCAWVDLHSDEYDVFLSLISAEGELPFNAENLQNLYCSK